MSNSRVSVRVDSNTVVPIVMGGAQSGFWRWLEGPAVRILLDVACFVVDDGLHKRLQFWILGQ